MNTDFPIFRTKLTPPQVKQTVLRRPSMVKKLRGIPDFPVTLVHSGPGYGKSTALASFLKGRNDFCWYTVSQQDDEMVSFLHYLVQAVRSQFPEFGTAILPKLDAMNQQYGPRTLCSEFVNELSMLEEDLIIVIDDYHMVDHSRAVEEWLLSFIEYMPECIHLVISSRVRPAWDVLAALKAKGSLLEIAESDFTFSYDEVDVLFSDFYHIELAPADIENILQKTEGWVMAIQMIGQQLSEREQLDKMLTNQAGSLEDLFHFLALEVFSKQSEEVQRFLRRTCVFDELSEPVLNQVLNMEGADLMLREVSGQNLFLFFLGEGQYRYHALFQNFLVSDLKNKDPGLFVELHRRAGRYFKEERLFEQAIFHYEAIEDYDPAAEILCFYGETMIDLGLLAGLKEKLDVLPLDIKNRYEALWIYEGDIYRYRCHYKEALACYQKAEQLSEDIGNDEGRALALEGRARVFLDTIQPGKAEGYLEKAVKMVSPAGPVNARQSRLFRLMAENLVNLGKAREAEKWLAR
ncbi:MAG TPA: transcriptional regulator, partial [Bacillales bacterium]